VVDMRQRTGTTAPCSITEMREAKKGPHPSTDADRLLWWVKKCINPYLELHSFHVPRFV
jgi:hypothetical protein